MGAMKEYYMEILHLLELGMDVTEVANMLHVPVEVVINIEETYHESI